MAQLSFVKHILTGNEQLDLGLSGLETVQVGGNNILLASSGQGGGLVSYVLGANNQIRAADTVLIGYDIAVGVGRPITVIETTQGLMVFTGQELHPNATSYSLTSSGNLSNASAVSGLQGQSVSWFAQSGESLLTGNLGDNGFHVFDWTRDGGVSAGAAVRDTGMTHVSSLSSLATANLGGRDFAIAGSASEFGISVYELNGNQATHTASMGADAGLGMMVPNDICVVEAFGTGFVLVASAPSSGEGGAISVMELSGRGQLQPTDHVLDTQDTRFGVVQALDWIEVNGQVFVVAGGGDGGVSLFQLMPTGVLVHLDALPGSAEAPLTGITDIAMTAAGDVLRIFITTASGEGVTLLNASIGQGGMMEVLGSLGAAITGNGQNDLLIGGTGRDMLNGGTGDDILQDGAGRDTLIGGAGADVFVMSPDGARDQIDGFNASVDTLDLSHWSFLYDTASLTIRETSSGAMITWRDEELVLNGTGLTSETVREAISIDVNRSFIMPELNVQGGSGNDVLEGSWGTDTLKGGAGRDTLVGGGGDDAFFGGAGEDTAVFDSRFRDVGFGYAVDGSLTISTSEGDDRFDSIELFTFDDRTLTHDQLMAQAVVVVHGGRGKDGLSGGSARDMIYGGAGNDVLRGKALRDTLDGGSGNDRLFGGVGRDKLLGQAGRDKLFGGGGNDKLIGGQGSDTLSGGGGKDRLLGGVGDDRLSGGAGADTLKGGSGGDRLSGGIAKDLLIGGGGEDTLLGNGGGDKLRGGAGADRLDGGAGNDRLEGGKGSDVLKGFTGNDTLVGGGGRDTFVFKGDVDRDRVVDFNKGVDRLLIGEEHWGRADTGREFISENASVLNGNVILDLSGGDTITLVGIGSLNGLAGDIFMG